MYEIKVERRRNEGTLTYSNGGVSVNTSCWWDPAVKIPALTYSGCSATHMTRKLNSRGELREGIYIPGVPGRSGIFIHMGTNAGWSDGCIVIIESELLRIWNDITPHNGENVTVTVRG